MEGPISHKPATARAGITKIELLVTTAIIGVLAALLLPAVQQARQAARRVSDMNDLGQVAKASIDFEMTHGHYPMNSTAFESQTLGGGVRESSLKHLLPFLEQKNTETAYKQQYWHFDTPNAAVSALDIPVFQSSSLPGSNSFPGQSDIAFIAGFDEKPRPLDIRSGGNQYQEFLRNQGWPVNGQQFSGIGQIDQRLWQAQSSSPFPKVNNAAVLDGTSNTYLLGYNVAAPASGEFIGNTESLVGRWSNPAYSLVTTGLATVRKAGDNVDNIEVRAGLALDAQVARADGSVSWVSKEIDRQVLKALSTKSGGEISH